MSEPIIKIENMNKWFGDFQVLKDVHLEVEKTKKLLYVAHQDQVNQH